MPALTEITRQTRPILGGTGGEIVHYPEAASQSFKAGDLVYLASGKVTIVAASGNNLASGGNEILGIALADASGTTDTDIPVQLITQETILRLPVYHSTPASAVTAVTTVANDYQLRHHTDATGWFVNIEQGSNPVVMVIGIDDTYPVGESYGYVFARVLQAELQMDA